MIAKHTPGPWMHDTVDGFTMVHVDNRGQTGQTITHMFDRHGAFKNASANARLIAAAPELADALKNALDVLGMNEYERESCRRRIRAVLDKAGL